MAKTQICSRCKQAKSKEMYTRGQRVVCETCTRAIMKEPPLEPTRAELPRGRGLAADYVHALETHIMNIDSGVLKRLREESGVK